MVYKNHQFVREALDQNDSSVWPDNVEPEFKSKFKNLTRSHPKIPYTIEVECTNYWGNFEREFIAYSFGILDDVQMRIKHSRKELEMFWKEVFNSMPPTFEEATVNYALLRDCLFETFQDVDDWWQLTFYNIDWDAYHKEDRHILRIQLAKPLGRYWENIIIPRMKTFFEKKIYEWMRTDTELVNISLLDRRGNVMKEYYNAI